MKRPGDTKVMVIVTFLTACFIIVAAENDYDVRLVNGKNDLEGRVEMFFNGTWQTICDDFWNKDDTNVVCRQLGFKTAISTTKKAYFGEGDGVIFGKYIYCVGTESRIGDCSMWGSGCSTCDHQDDSGVICGNGQDDYIDDVQLVNGKDTSEGRVEVLVNGNWLTICEDYWDMGIAEVVCRQLGFMTAVSATKGAFFGEGDGPIFGKYFSCSGTENRIGDCSAWDSGYTCDHQKDSGVICASEDDYIDDVQLVNGKAKDSSEGRVEVLVNGNWLTICDDNWNMDNANVVCKQLGFTTAISATKGAFFGEGDGPVLGKHFSCSGTESKIGDCSAWNSGYICGHQKDSGVICASEGPHDVRLVGGTTHLEGRVEVFLDGVWGTVCDDGWDLYDATVVCRQLGYGSVAAVKSSAYFGQGSGSVLLDDVSCRGMESRLQDCPVNRQPDCGHNEDVGVICLLPEPYAVRLVGGSNYREGRVEVYKNDAWGTICDDNWDVQDGTVVCRQLGFEGAKSISTGAEFGQGSGAIVFTGVGCNGFENTLRECFSWNTPGTCSHSEDAGVTCIFSAKEGDVRLVDGPSKYKGRVEIFQVGQWGTVCSSRWTLSEADIVCKQLGYGVASDTGSSLYGPGTGLIMLYNVNCHGHESRLDQCQYDSYDQDTFCTSHWYDASVDCTLPSTSLSSVAVVGIVAGSICIFLLVFVLLIKLLCGRKPVTPQPAGHRIPTISEVTVRPELHSIPLHDAPPSYTMVMANDSRYPKVPTPDQIVYLPEAYQAMPQAAAAIPQVAPLQEPQPPSYSPGPADENQDLPLEPQAITLTPEDGTSTSNLLL